MKHPNLNPVKDSHCSYCGAKFMELDKYPRRCFICWNDTYKNPIPVVVVMVRVFQRSTYASSQCGWLIIQRGIEPGKGGWAFPGGYMEFGETYQQACARELKEEVGLDLPVEDFTLQDARIGSKGHLLLFCSGPGVYRDEIQFTPNEEVLAVDYPILPEHQELCFPSHNEMWQLMYDYESI